MSENIEKPRPDQGEWEGGSTTCPDRTLEKRRSFLAKLTKRFAEDLAKDSRDQQWKFEPMKFPEDLKLYYHNPKAVRFLDKLYRAMRYDNRSRFVKLIQREIAVGTVRRSGIIFHPSLLLFMAINSKAVLIAKSILDRSAGLGVSDLYEGPNAFDPPPAFAAARRFLPEMVNELDFYGARFDIPSRFYSSGYYLMVPFEAAIKGLGDKISWSLDQYLDVLIHSLCGNLNLELETISLLMGKTQVDRIKNVILEYTGKLNVVGLTVLLYVDSTSGHFGLLKEFSAEVYSSLVKAAGDPCTELDYDVCDRL